jgi:hypothetical protein
MKMDEYVKNYNAYMNAEELEELEKIKNNVILVCSALLDYEKGFK